MVPLPFDTECTVDLVWDYLTSAYLYGTGVFLRQGAGQAAKVI